MKEGEGGMQTDLLLEFAIDASFFCFLILLSTFTYDPPIVEKSRLHRSGRVHSRANRNASHLFPGLIPGRRHRHSLARGVPVAIRAGNGHGVDAARALTGAYGAQTHLVWVTDRPMQRRVTIT